QADGAEHQDHATDQTALLDAIPQVRLALQLRQQGTLLAQLQRQPDLWDRVKQGGLVGGVILVLGAIGL
ncbi:hypothetical protein, partial [Stutzerimonas stutzeri]|uniref:hypothetical protein n=1 Tax=Stutzerimonas stutzeri TaxID=316 RepID=UPI0024B677EF